MSKTAQCPHCGKQVALVAAEPTASAVSNGLLADLKPWLDQGTITIDPHSNPIRVRMPYDATADGKRNWRAVNAMIARHKGVWVPAGKDSRWEVPA